MTLISIQLTTQYFNMNLFNQSLTFNWRGLNYYGRHIRIECALGIAMWASVGTIVKRRERGINPPAYRVLYATKGMERYA